MIVQSLRIVVGTWTVSVCTTVTNWGGGEAMAADAKRAVAREAYCENRIFNSEGFACIVRYRTKTTKTVRQ